MDLVRIGSRLRALRRRRGMRQVDLAAAVGVSASTISRIELGRILPVQVGTIMEISRVLGAVLELDVRWQGEGLDRLMDSAHADLVEEVVRRLRATGWETAVEASFAIAGERGSVDILAFHSETGWLLVIEVKSAVPDLQGTLHGLDRKARLGRSIAAQRGWRVRGVARLLVIGDTRTNRRRLAGHGATMAAVLPASGREVTRWLTSPSSAALAGHWFLPFSRRVGRMSRGRQRVRLRQVELNALADGGARHSLPDAHSTRGSQREPD